jgi:hypothetical protein
MRSRPKQQLAVDDASKGQEEADALARGMTDDELAAAILRISEDETANLRVTTPFQTLCRSLVRGHRPNFLKHKWRSKRQWL